MPCHLLCQRRRLEAARVIGRAGQRIQLLLRRVLRQRRAGKKQPRKKEQRSHIGSRLPSADMASGQHSERPRDGLDGPTGQSCGRGTRVTGG